MKLGGIYVSVGAKTTKLKRDLAKAEGMTKKTAVLMRQEIGRITFAKVGIAAAAFTLGVAALGKKVITLGREFESTMKTVQAWSGATGKDLKSLTDIARKMGATTEHTATEAAGALKFLAAAGFSAKKSIAALPGTLNLATAGQVALAEATDITTDVLTAFGLQVEELSRVNDAFITTSSSSNTNVLMLGQSMKMVAPTAKLFGLTVEQTAAFLGTLANAGVKAEMAGSGLNMVLLKSARAAKKLGLEAGTPLIEVLKKMKEAQWGAVEIGEAFGARQVKTAAILMDGIKNYEKLTQKILDNVGATARLADVIRDSLDVDLKTLNSTIEEELLRTFDRYKDDIRKIVQDTTAWIRQNTFVIDELVDLAKNMAIVAVAMGKIIGLGAEYVGVWMKTWQAMGLASAGVITWRDALLDGTHSMELFETEQGRLQLQARLIEQQIIDLKKVTEGQIFYFAEDKAEIKSLELRLVAIQQQIEKSKQYAPGRLDQALEDPSKYYGALPDIPEAPEAPSSVYKQTEKMKAIYVKYYAALEEMENEAFMNEITRERERLAELEPFIAARFNLKEEEMQEWRDFEEQKRIAAEETAAYQAELHKGMLGSMTEAWEDYAANTEPVIQQISKLSVTMAQNFAAGVGNAFAQAIVYGKSLSEAFAEMLKQLAAQIISSLIRIGVEKLILWIVQKALNLAEATSRMAILSAETFAAAYASTCAIPIVGPILAPGVAAASLAAMTAGSMAAASSGMAMGAAIGSMDQGGITEREGLYRTGPIREAHIPLSSGEKIPVEIKDEDQKPSIIFNIFGDVVDYDEFARKIVPSMEKAMDDGVH